MNIFSILQKHNFELISVVTHLADGKKEWYPLHFNSDSHLIHIIKGKGRFKIREEEFEITENMGLFIPSVTPFYIKIDSPAMEMVNIHYNIFLEDKSNLEKQVLIKRNFCFNKIEGVAEKLHELAKLRRNNSLKTYSLAYEIVLNYYSYPELLVKSNYHNDERMKMLENMLADKSLLFFDSKALAEKCHLSVSQMNRRFRKFYGMSPQEFWDRQRFLYVSEELRMMDCETSINDISEKFGFCDISYFSRWFKRKSGYSPKKYFARLIDYKVI